MIYVWMELDPGKCMQSVMIRCKYISRQLLRYIGKGTLGMVVLRVLRFYWNHVEDECTDIFVICLLCENEVILPTHRVPCDIRNNILFLVPYRLL